jgi:hypothetical protein
MPEIKRSVQARVVPRDRAVPEADDVTALFSPPPELLEQMAARDTEMTAAPAAMRSSWESSEDEATLIVRESFSALGLKPLKGTPASEPRPTAPASHSRPTAPAALAPVSQPRPAAAANATRPAPRNPSPLAAPRSPSPAAPPVRVEIGEAELGAILGPRRVALWLAVGAGLTLLLILLAVARLAP